MLMYIAVGLHMHVPFLFVFFKLRNIDTSLRLHLISLKVLESNQTKTVEANMKQKIVIKVDMKCQKCRIKALKVALGKDGVSYVKLEGDEKDKVVVIGDGVDAVDAVDLVRTLRKKIGAAQLISVEDLEKKFKLLYYKN